VGALLVYDISRRPSFETLAQWSEEVKKYASNPNIVLLVVGNKSDLAEKYQL
jgi:Ras-related protein Rab-11A